MARVNVTADLGAFLERMVTEPFVEGVSDCVMTVADWVVLNGRPDPAEPYRGRYSTLRGRRLTICQAGGLRSLMTAGAERAGLSMTKAPQCGDVGLIRVRRQVLAAICLGPRWAMKGCGLVVAEADDVLVAWSL